MFSERLLALLAEQGAAPDYQRLAADVLGIRNAPPALARRLVEQAILVTDWRERWRRVGERATSEAPCAPGVYVFRDAAGDVLYVGKAANLRHRLRAHFSARRWLSLPPGLARVATVEWEPLGSELEAILREAALIRDLQPVVNVQTGPPSLAARTIPQPLVRDVLLLLPSIDPDAAEIVAARADGATLLRRTPRSGAGSATLCKHFRAFFNRSASAAGDSSAAPLVFSWLAGRGQDTTRIDPHGFRSTRELRAHLVGLLADRALFTERLVVQETGPRQVPAHPQPSKSNRSF